MGKGRDNLESSSERFSPIKAFLPTLLNLISAVGPPEIKGSSLFIDLGSSDLALIDSGEVALILREIVPLLEVALTHRSASLEDPSLLDNERLEFLGDAIIEARVSWSLYLHYLDRDEGFLTLARSSLVNTDALASIAIMLGLDDFVILGLGERATGGTGKRTILAGLFEAVVGAIYLDLGAACAWELIDRTVLIDVENISLSETLLDPKSQLQIYFAKASLAMPVYESTKTGPDHAPLFVTDVILADGRRLRGEGTSKKEAEQRAARRALVDLEILG
ncbi:MULTISPECIES: ribonuclease III [Acidithrix]|uniref:Ribonuclease 3 n=1 Tax=Acidithrix ferrooxidans TaxID=1280514 RepID=A0A0D8HDJ4_9ACTN|nr:MULTISPECIES: ribonuclease III [Acidithrix]KJF15954.1 ribonuclease 3 [Acidithrix ferrooxidans]CAG4904391.1 unnamed protein product [Acidithrix sp. C25]